MNFLPESAKTYLPVPVPAGGLVTPEYLEAVCRIAKKFQIPHIKITSSQRLAFVGFKESNRESIQEFFTNHFPETSCSRSLFIQACPGSMFCRNGMVNSIALAEKIQDQLNDASLPGKIKIGLSACPRNCCSALLKDIGIYSNKNGLIMAVGGNGGTKPRIGDVVQKGLSENDALSLIDKFIALYAAQAHRKERTARFIERIGLAQIKKELSRE